MNPTGHGMDLQTFVSQSRDHHRVLLELLGGREPPGHAALQRLTNATRALRGSASVLGLDTFQSFLGRLFAVLEDVEGSEIPWSGRLEVVLEEAYRASKDYLEALDRGESRPSTDDLLHSEARLASWRRDEARRFGEPLEHADSQHVASQSDASQIVTARVTSLLEQARELQTLVGRGSQGDLLQEQLMALGRRLVALGESLGHAVPPAVVEAEDFEEGLRNHCEGALRSLVEAAAQEVLDEARERGLRLAIRATGSLQKVEDELGGALLELLRNLWSDSLLLQAEAGEAQIDCVVRLDEDRLVVEVRDPAVTNNGVRGDDDVLGHFPGLRRSSPLVQSLQGLVWVEPADAPGCRFRVALPREMARTAVQVVRIGVHEVALPSAAVEAVYPFDQARVHQDRAGAVVEVGGGRYPLLHLAFVLRDESFDELEREVVLVVGSFERRVALLASGPCKTIQGAVRPRAEAPWLGWLNAPSGELPLLDVGSLLGRKRAAGQDSQAEAVAPAGGTVLVVNSSEVERNTITALLGQTDRRTLAVQSADEAWEMLGHEGVDLLICDLRLPEMNAQRLAELRRRTGKNRDVPVLLVLSHAGGQSHLVVRQLGAKDFVRSPIQRDELVRAVQHCAVEA